MCFATQTAAAWTLPCGMATSLLQPSPQQCPCQAKWLCWTLKVKALCFFEMWGNANLVTQCHSPEQLDSQMQQNYFECIKNKNNKQISDWSGWLPHYIIQWLSHGLSNRRTGVLLPAVADSALLHSIQAGSAAYLVSYSMGSDGSFHMGEATGEWNWPLTSDQCWGSYCFPLCAIASDAMQTSLSCNTFTQKNDKGEKLQSLLFVTVHGPNSPAVQPSFRVTFIIQDPCFIWQGL